jgi:hypothetical protein
MSHYAIASVSQEMGLHAYDPAQGSFLVISTSM